MDIPPPDTAHGAPGDGLAGSLEPHENGTRVEVTGCDLLIFRNGRIAVTSACRKQRPAF